MDKMNQSVKDNAGVTLIHIYGTDSSGSTMLDLILGNAPDAFSCGEVSAWFRPYRKHHFRIECTCRQDLCPVWEKIKDAPENDFHAAVARELNVHYVIDSSKDICWLIDAQKWAADGGIRTINLMIWKDLIDLAYSYWKRGVDVSLVRNIFVKRYGRILQIGLPFVSINYGELVESPDRSVEKLCSVLGMPYFEGKVRFSEKQHHHLFGSGEIRAQTGTKDARIKGKKIYPKEFEAQWSKLQKQLENDTDVIRIIRAFRQVDALSMDQKNIQAMDFVPHQPLPLWYYLYKVLRWFRRYFPEDFKPPVVREA